MGRNEEATPIIFSHLHGCIAGGWLVKVNETQVLRRWRAKGVAGKKGCVGGFCRMLRAIENIFPGWFGPLTRTFLTCQRPPTTLVV